MVDLQQTLSDGPELVVPILRIRHMFYIFAFDFLGVTSGKTYICEGSRYVSLCPFRV